MTEPRIRILFLNSPERFGADTWVQALLMRSLDRARFEVHAACAVGPNGAPTPAFETFARIPDLVIRPTNFGPSLAGRSRIEKLAAVPSGLAFGASLAGLAAYVRRHRIEVVHATDRPRDAMSCAIVGSLGGARSVVHLHVKCDDWMGRGARWAFRRADALVGISDFVSRSLVSNGYDERRVHTVLNAIDPAAWDFDLDPAPVRRELGIDHDAPVVMCASRLFRWKGHADLIRSVAEVKREAPGVRLLIVGSVDSLAGSADYLDELKKLTAELGLSENVVFTGQRSDMVRLFAASDVFAMASFEEPFGLVFAEAMAMKRPVVSLETGGIPEVVVHGETGLLSPPRDIHKMAANLLALLRDPPLRKKMGENGRRRVEARFTPDRMAKDAERLYFELVRRTPN